MSRGSALTFQAAALAAFPIASFLSGCASPGADAPAPAAAPALSAPVAPAPDPAPDPALEAEIQRLQARASELEKRLNTAPPADVKAMLEMIGRGEAVQLSRELEKHLLRGPEGYAVMHDFFHEADIQHEKIDALTHHPQLIYCILRLVALYPNEVAEASRHLIKATKDRPESWIRRELFNFLPVFILHHPGRYPELRRELEEDIVYQIEMGGAFLYKVSLAMRDLDFRPPVEIFLPLLLDPKKYELHGMVVEHLAGRKEEGLEILCRYLHESRDFKTPTVGAVLSAVMSLEKGLEPGKASGRVEKLLEHPDADLRRAAYFVYFEEPRDVAELPRVIDLLNSESCTLLQKRAFITLLAQKSLDLFQVLFEQADGGLKDEAVKAHVRRTAEALARRKAKKQASAPKQAGNIENETK